MRWLVAGLWLAVAAGCNEEPAADPGVAASGGSAAAKPSPGGGFSADLAKELASARGSGDAKAGSGDAKAGSGDAKAGSAEGSGTPADAKAGSGSGSGSGDAKAGSGEPPPKAGSGEAPKAGSGEAPKAGSAEPPLKAGSGEAPKAGSGEAKPAGGSSEPAPKAPPTPPTPPTPPSGGPKKMSAELAAIKFGMLPNWDRDVQEPGTISLAVKVPGKGTSVTFVFHYGYEDAGAPADRDAYKKWLADKRVLAVRQDRQAGAAWFLEGTDGRGGPAFRAVVSWGGKRLICYGSLYRDAESSKLGDLRDQTLIQAKQICESISL